MVIAGLKDRSFKGFMADDEAERLYELAQEAAVRGPCLEIGSYCGLSAAYLGLGCQKAGSVLYSLDHHEGSEEQQPGEPYHDSELIDPATGRLDTLPLFRKTLRDLSLEKTVIPIVSRSEIVSGHWTTPLSLIFIDGGHTDYNGWVSHLMAGGYLLIHDIFPDAALGGQAPACIYEMALASGLFLEWPMVGTLGVLQRAPAGTLTETSRRHWEQRQC
jgi:hypothetical protein